MSNAGVSRHVLWLALAMAAGCAASAPAVPAEGVEVRKIERLRWDAPVESELYRVDFGAQLSAQIRRQARDDYGDLDRVHAELAEMEKAAEREFRARGLCPQGVRMISVVEGTEDAPALAGFFRCGRKGIF